MNGNGPLDFQVYVGDADFKKTFNSMERRATSFTRHVDKEVSSLDATFAKLGQVAAGAFAIGELSQLPGQIVKVRGEFQQLEIALNTMLGSKEKGDKLLSEIVTTAASTPFGLKDLAAATKQLLAYGSASDSVIKEIRMLGDVASGVSVPIGELVYLYGTLRSQGRAYAVDIRQFAGRGIPIYAELAKVLNVGVGEVNALVEAGKVGFPQVEQAFRNMTSGAGMFSGLMDAQSKSLTGLIERLKDGIDVAFNDIGKANQGLAEDVITGATVVVENYQNVADILTVLIGTYGAYRAALVLVNTMKTTEATSYAAITAGINAQSGATERAIALETRRAQATALRKTALADEAFALSLNAAAQVQSLRADVAAAAAKRTSTIETAKSAAAEVTSATARLAAAQANQVATANYLSATVREAAAKEVLNAQNALLIASENGVTARKAASAASADFLAKKTALETATKTANSLVTKTNTTAEAAGIATKGAAAVATTRLTSLQALQIAVTRQATAAQLAFNGTLLANPIVLATVGLAALAGAMWYLSDSTTAAELAQKSLNQILEDQKKRKEDLVSKTSELTGVINNESSTTFAQIQAYSSLQKLYPALLNNLTLQEFKLLKATDAQKQLNAAMDQMGISGTNGEFDKANKRIDELTKKLDNLKKQQAQAGPGSGAFVAPIARAQTELEAARISAEKLGEQVKQNTADAWEANTPVEDQIKHYQTLQGSLFDQRKTIEESITKMQKMGGTAQGLKPFFDQLTLTGLNQQIDQVAGKIGALMGNRSAVVDGGNKAYWEKVKSDANDKRDNLGISKSGSSEWKALTKEIDAADKKLQAYSATKKVAERKVPEKDKPKPFGSIAYYEQISRKADEIIAKTPGSNTGEIAKQNKIKIDAEAKADEIRKQTAVKTFDQELEEKKNKYEQYQRWVDHYSKESADAQFAGLIKQGDSYAAYLDGEIRKLEAQKGTSGIGLIGPEEERLVKLKVEFSETTGAKSPVQLLEDQLSSAKDEAQSLSEYLDILYAKQGEIGSGGGSTGNDKRKIVAQQIVETEKELKQVLNSFLSESAVYTKKRFDVEQKYMNLRKTAYKKLNREELSDALKAIDTQRKAEMEAMADEEQEQSATFKKLHAEYLDYGRKQIKERLANLQTLLKAEEISAQRRKDLEFELAKVKRELDQKTAKGFREAAGLLNSVLGDIDLNFSKTFAISMRDLSGAMSNVSTLMDSGASTMEQIGSIIGLVSFVAVTVRDAFMTAEDLITGMEVQESYYANIKNEVEGVNILLERQATLLDRLTGTKKIQGSFDLIGEYAKKQEDSLKALQDMSLDVISKQTEVFVDPILGTKVKNKGFAGVWTSLMTGGKAKTKIEYQFENIDTSGYDDIEDFIQLLADIKKGGGKLNGKEVVDADLQALELLINTYQEAEAAQLQLLEDFKTFLTATTQAGIVDSIVEGFRSGKVAASDFADDFQTMMQNALLNSLKANMMNQDMDLFYKKFSDFSLSDGVLTGTEIAELQSDYAALIEKGRQQYEDIQKVSGIDLSSSAGTTGKDPLSGAIRGVSEETASVLAGQFNAIRISNADIMVSMRQSLLYQSRIADNTEFNRKLVVLDSILSELRTSNATLIRGFG